MKQIGKDKLCKYCTGCNQLELSEFKPVMRCKNFVPGYDDWQEMLRKELKKK